MSKIKLLYDVSTTMKDKESCSGKLKVEGSKDQVKIFALDNEFEKNMADGKVKAKVTKDPSNPEFIETLWGTGYRFTGARRG